MLLQLAQSEAHSHAPPLRLKKLYLLAALEVDQLKARMLNIGDQANPSSSPSRAPQQASDTSTAAHTLAGTHFVCVSVARAVHGDHWVELERCR